MIRDWRLYGVRDGTVHTLSGWVWGIADRIPRGNRWRLRLMRLANRILGA